MFANPSTPADNSFAMVVAAGLGLFDWFKISLPKSSPYSTSLLYRSPIQSSMRALSWLVTAIQAVADIVGLIWLAMPRVPERGG